MANPTGRGADTGRGFMPRGSYARRRFLLAAALLAGFVLLMVGPAQATPGALDSSFDADGKVTTDFASATDYGYGVVIQPDGKMVLAGSAYTTTNEDFALSRYKADGSLDSGFGAGGKVTTAIGSSLDEALDVALQTDAKIVAAGYSHGANDDFALIRYKADGSLDTTFGTGGKVTTAIGSDFDKAYAVAIQPDGKIVAAGVSFVGVSTTNDFALVRYNADGSPDSSFDSDGIVTTAIGPAFDQANAVVIQPDGKTVAAGYTGNGANTDFAVVRYNADGSPDSSFGSGGIATTAIGSGDDDAFDVGVQPDGKIIAAGRSRVGSADDVALVRYNADGTLDSSFDSDGKVTTSIGPAYDQAHAVVIQPDGKIVVAGYSDNGTDDDFAVIRYNADGSLDTGFGLGGKVTTAIGSANEFAYGIAIQSDGKIVAAGWSRIGTTADFALVRYLGSTLSVSKAGSGSGTVTSSPSGIDCGSSCSAPFAAVPVTLTATAAAGSSFAGWSGDCSGTGTCSPTMSADHTVTATFEADKTLTVAKAGSGSGTITSSPAGISCGSTCAHAFAHGIPVTLTATAASGSSFTGWSGNCSGTGGCTLTMDADRAAVATFQPVPSTVFCHVPKVKGKKLRAAKRAIRRAHCSVGRIKRVYSARVRKGRVVSQKPKAGAKRPAGTKVGLKVSKGKRP